MHTLRRSKPVNQRKAKDRVGILERRYAALLRSEMTGEGNWPERGGIEDIMGEGGKTGEDRHHVKRAKR